MWRKRSLHEPRPNKPELWRYANARRFVYENFYYVSTGYGDLDGAANSEAPEITFAAQPGLIVHLRSLQLGTLSNLGDYNTELRIYDLNYRLIRSLHFITPAMGHFQFTCAFCASAGGLILQYSSGVHYLAIDNIDVTVTAAMFEPATWALLIAGFGLTGVALRRRTAAFAWTRA